MIFSFVTHTVHILTIDILRSRQTDRRLYAHCAQNINSYELVPEESHCHTVSISHHCNFMLVNFVYFRRSIIQPFHSSEDDAIPNYHVGSYSFVLK